MDPALSPSLTFYNPGTAQMDTGVVSRCPMWNQIIMCWDEHGILWTALAAIDALGPLPQAH